MKRWIFVLFFPFVVFATPTNEAFPDTVVITMEYWSPYYQPSRAVTPYGEVLSVVNKTASAHTIRHDNCLDSLQCLFDTGIVRPEDKVSLPPLPPGEYPYHCELHPIMRGTIIVKMPEEPGEDRKK